jgi:hypothetical protein
MIVRAYATPAKSEPDAEQADAKTCFAQGCLLCGREDRQLCRDLCRANLPCPARRPKRLRSGIARQPQRALGTPCGKLRCATTSGAAQSAMDLVQRATSLFERNEMHRQQTSPRRTACQVPHRYSPGAKPRGKRAIPAWRRPPAFRRRINAVEAPIRCAGEDFEFEPAASTQQHAAISVPLRGIARSYVASGRTVVRSRNPRRIEPMACGSAK